MIRNKPESNTRKHVPLSAAALERVKDAFEQRGPFPGLERVWCEILGVESLSEHDDRINPDDYAIPEAQSLRILRWGAKSTEQWAKGTVSSDWCAACFGVEWADKGPLCYDD